MRSNSPASTVRLLRVALAAIVCPMFWVASTSGSPPVPSGLQPGNHYHLVFVTSLVLGIDTNTSIPPSLPFFGGLGAGDWAVTNSAAVAGLIDNWNSSDLIYKAVLSTSSVDARDHINVQGPVYNTHGDLVATGAPDLWDGSIAAPIQYDESGNLIPSGFAVWSGSSTAGTKTLNNTAGDWHDPTKNATIGIDSKTDGQWIQISTLSASSSARLYGISPLLTVPVPGDYNNNGVADAADYILWRKGSTLADGNHNHMIDTGDYNLWRAHFGETLPGLAASAGNAAVPEPPSFTLLLVLGVIMWLSGQRRFLTIAN